MFFRDRHFRNIVLDMDGTIYRSQKPITGSPECIDFFRRAGCRIVFMSNNSALTRKQYVAKLSRMGIEAKEEEIIHSSLITAYYLKKEKPGARIYVIGEDGLTEELIAAGMVLTDNLLTGKDVDCVVVGLDREFSYRKMKTAMRAILEGADFFGTNPDQTYPDEAGLSPSAGAILAAIAACSGVKPRIFGKPAPEAMELLLEISGFCRGATMLIGDRMDTDITLAWNAGIFSVLVLSGVTGATPEETGGVLPDLVVQDLAELHRRLEQDISPVE
ncbi:MAG TPA: HAD-IIA family hydrolase [Atribacteraceae bacterium]|nr:HAD-IIA family hydrolase [Atribacteraceae bacterium]